MPTKKVLNLEDKLRRRRNKIRMKVSGRSTFAIMERIRSKGRKRHKK